MPSSYICRRCELPVGRWAKGSGLTWKHFASPYTTSCGKPPLVVEREVYEREMLQFVEDAFSAIRLFDKSP